jgi:DNA-binding GntR family transcriptional regulator
MGTAQTAAAAAAGTTTGTDGRGRLGEEQQSRRERVYQALREELMSGGIAPWERLAEERLAERFAVSRTPVREALARLRSDGLVERRAGGLYLYMPSFEDLADLYELRITIELQGIRRAIDDPTVRHDGARLEAELATWQGLSDDQPPPAPGFVRVDEQFHTVLLDSSGNRALSAALAGVSQRIRAVRMYDYLTADRMRATIDEHLEIAGLVLSGRLRPALDALHAHVGDSKAVVVERAAQALAMTRMGHAVEDVR